MFNIFKNILCLIIIHIFANIGSCVILLLGIVMLSRFGDRTPIDYTLFLDSLIILFTFGRLLVLPIAYKKLENSQKFDLVAKFIQNLKQSFRLKIAVLIIAYFSYRSLGFPYFDNGFYAQLFQSVIFGLLGNYIVLFAYWFIENKIKNIIQKHRH